MTEPENTKPPAEEVIETLESLLEDAKQGKITGLYAIAKPPIGDKLIFADAGMFSSFEAIGAFEAFKARLISEIYETSEEYDD